MHEIGRKALEGARVTVTPVKSRFGVPRPHRGKLIRYAFCVAVPAAGERGTAR